MEPEKISRKPRKHCHNCALACNGMFCCEWCLIAYCARRDAHRLAERRRAQSQSETNSTPGEGHRAEGD